MTFLLSIWQTRSDTLRNEGILNSAAWHELARRVSSLREFKFLRPVPEVGALDGVALGAPLLRKVSIFCPEFSDKMSLVLKR